MSDRTTRHGSAPRSRPRRALRLLGGLLAFVLTVTLAAGVGYAITHLEELKAQVPRLDGQDVKSPVDQATDDAVAYAGEVNKPRQSDGNGPGYELSAAPPVGVDAPHARWCPDQVIGYRIDATAARAAGSTLAKERARWRGAFQAWREASGGRYRFAYRGSAKYPVQQNPESFPIDPVAVPEGEIAITYAFAPGDERMLPGYAHRQLEPALGFAGIGPVDWRPGPFQALITRGMVVMDAGDSAADPHAVPVPYIHETGHALGLGHVEDSGQMMAADAGSTSVINDGDRAGLARLVRLGCG